MSADVEREDAGPVACPSCSAWDTLAKCSECGAVWCAAQLGGCGAVLATARFATSTSAGRPSGWTPAVSVAAAEG
jgi:hypothetical protein